MAYHVISFEWQGFVPHLYYCDTTSDRIKKIKMEKLDMSISHHASCVGRWNGREYIPCPHDARVHQGNICQDCAGDLLPNLACNFEPLCDGEICANNFCRQEHAVYLAFHGEIAKVGTTTTRRIQQRMIEQGCDAFSILARVDGRASARALEVSLSEKLGLRQRIREVESLFCMTEKIPVRKIESKYADIAPEVESIGLRPGPLEFLEGYPLETPLTSMPRPTSIEGRHEGRVIGQKGKFLVYENDGVKAINMQRIPGRFITWH